MATTVPPAGLNTPTGAQAATDDVYSRMLRSNVQSAIEDIILVDEQDPDAPSVCTCGMCETDENGLLLTDSSTAGRNNLGGAPIYYIETRADSDPVVLDEYAIAADIETISPHLIAKSDAIPDAEIVDSEPVYTAPGLEDLLSDDDEAFDPAAFDPFDPGIDQSSMALTIGD